MKTDIFTINVYNLTTDEDVTPMRLAVNYYDFGTAQKVAEEYANELVDEDDVIEINVFAGEYEDENGNVWGDHDVIYTATNANKEQSADTRQKNGYCTLEVDYYAK